MRINKRFSSNSTNIREIVQNEEVDAIMMTFDRDELQAMFYRLSDDEVRTGCFQQEKGFLTIGLTDGAKKERTIINRIDINDLATISDLEFGLSIWNQLEGTAEAYAGIGSVSLMVPVGHLHIFDKSVLTVNFENQLKVGVYVADVLQSEYSPEIEFSTVRFENAPDKILEMKYWRENTFTVPNCKAVYCRYNHDNATHAHLKQIIEVQTNGEKTSASFRAYSGMTNLINRVEMNPTYTESFVNIYEDEDDLCEEVSISSQIADYEGESHVLLRK